MGEKHKDGPCNSAGSLEDPHRKCVLVLPVIAGSILVFPSFYSAKKIWGSSSEQLPEATIFPVVQFYVVTLLLSSLHPAADS